MIKLPDELTPKAASRAYGGQVEGYRDGWNACIAEVQLLNATAQPVSDKPSLKAMMNALDAFYADESVPESAMMKAFRILLADVMPAAAPGGQWWPPLTTKLVTNGTFAPTIAS